MASWLMKTEPSAFSIETLRRQGIAPWDGVRNYAARNAMRQMRRGDRVFIYHSNASPSGIAGLAVVEREAYPDHTSWDPHGGHFDPASTPEAPRWDMVDVRFVRAFPTLLPAALLKAHHGLQHMVLFRQSRLSVQPVSEAEARVILALSEATPAAEGRVAAVPRSRTARDSGRPRTARS
jgi:predicted RNA-binding protein with PUA-like domain